MAASKQKTLQQQEPVQIYHSATMSGIPANQECIDKYNAMQLNKKHSYIIMAIKDEKEVVVEEAGEPFPDGCTPSENEEKFNELKARFLQSEGEPKFLVFDFKMETKDGRREKLGFINWCSDSYPIKKKMVQGATAEDLKKKFQGLGKSFQANDADELDYKEFVKELKKK